MQAVRLLEKLRLKDAEEEAKWKSILIKLYLNLSLCKLRMRKPKLAITHCRDVLELDGKNVKATFRLGQVNAMLCKARTMHAMFTCEVTCLSTKAQNQGVY